MFFIREQDLLFLGLCRIKEPYKPIFPSDNGKNILSQ